MFLSPRGTTQRRLIDLLFVSDMSQDKLVRSLSDISRPTIKRLIEEMIESGIVRKSHGYMLTKEGRQAVIAEQTENVRVNSFKPLHSSRYLKVTGNRPGADEHLSWPSVFA